MVLYNPVQYLSVGVAMQTRLYVASNLFKILFLYSNMLEQLGSLATVSYVTKGSSYYASLFAFFTLFIFSWTHSDSLSYVGLSSMMMAFDLSLSVEQICDKISSTRNSFDFLLSAEQTCVIRICFLEEIYAPIG